jgi:hypothetical protein
MKWLRECTVSLAVVVIVLDPSYGGTRSQVWPWKSTKENNRTEPASARGPVIMPGIIPRKPTLRIAPRVAPEGLLPLWMSLSSAQANKNLFIQTEEFRRWRVQMAQALRGHVDGGRLLGTENGRMRSLTRLYRIHRCERAKIADLADQIEMREHDETLYELYWQQKPNLFAKFLTFAAGKLGLSSVDVNPETLRLWISQFREDGMNLWADTLIPLLLRYELARDKEAVTETKILREFFAGLLRRLGMNFVEEGKVLEFPADVAEINRHVDEARRDSGDRALHFHFWQNVQGELERSFWLDQLGRGLIPFTSGFLFLHDLGLHTPFLLLAPKAFAQRIQEQTQMARQLETNPWLHDHALRSMTERSVYFHAVHLEIATADGSICL